jgi:hypothetical protein
MTTWEKVRNCLPWFPTYFMQRLFRRLPHVRPIHLMFAVADHFEPAILPDVPGAYADREVQKCRVERWCHEYPKLVDAWRDSDGYPFRHTYFYPAEQYDAELIDRLAEHSRAGWGEVEVHLHHGIPTPDTPERERGVLLTFRDLLVKHGCLSKLDGEGPPRYAFVHGNWALANLVPGKFCGVDNEMQILAETGCYADFTLPSAPSFAQVPKINALYECALPLDRRAPHRRGRDLRRGRAPTIFPLIVQGPLMLGLQRRKGLPFPRIENSELAANQPPQMTRLRHWRRAAITVQGRPDWVFIKLHCHGMDPRDEAALLGSPMQEFLRQLVGSQTSGEYRVHFVTAREMVNIILAACDSRDGTPSDFRDYRLRLITTSREAYKLWLPA